jgi:hypothetical protein
MFPTHSEIRE